MIIVADTSPINYLVLIGAIDILKALFGRVIIPQAVLGELQHEKTPTAVKVWCDAYPDWLEVRQVGLSFILRRGNSVTENVRSLRWLWNSTQMLF
jgi:predicted nucleic acid-binding protein